MIVKVNDILKLHKWRIFTVILISILSTIFGIFAIGTIYPALQFIQYRGNIPKLLNASGLWKFIGIIHRFLNIDITLYSIFSICFFLFIMGATLMYIRSLVKLNLKEIFLKDIREQIIYTLLKSRVDLYEGVGKGRIVNTITLEAQRAAEVMFSFTHLISRIILIAGVITLAFFISRQLTSFVLGASVTVGFFVRKNIKYLKMVGLNISQENIKFKKAFYDLLNEYKTILINGCGKLFNKKLVDFNNQIKEYKYKAGKVSISISFKVRVLLYAFLLVTIYIAYSFLKMDVSSFVFFSVNLVIIYHLIMVINVLYNSILVNYPSFQMINTILYDLHLDVDRERRNKDFPSVFPYIECKNIEYSYKNKKDNYCKQVLFGISAKFYTGKVSLIIGRSGSSKTTLLDIVSGVRVQDAGDVFLGGVNLREISYSKFLEKIAYIPQFNGLLSGTIIDNIVYGRSNVSAEKAVEAIELVGLHDEIKSLKYGYNTIIGDGNHSFSSGEIQRIAIARALVKRPKILFLDEPTSSLDLTSEHEIINMVRKIQLNTGMTLIIVSHRPTILEIADYVLMLEKGKVLFTGDILDFKRNYVYS